MNSLYNLSTTRIISIKVYVRTKATSFPSVLTIELEDISFYFSQSDPPVSEIHLEI